MKKPTVQTNIKKRRILLCLKNVGLKSVDEITDIYNRLYPPHIMKKLFGIKLESAETGELLKCLVAEKLVRYELLSFTNHSLPRPKKFFVLTQSGTQSVF